VAVIGSGCDQVFESLQRYINNFRHESLSLKQIGLMIVSHLNQWSIGSKKIEALKKGFGGSFIYIVHNKKNLVLPPPHINFFGIRQKDQLLITSSGFIFYRGAAILFSSDTQEKKVIVSNRDFEYEQILSLYKNNKRKFMRKISNKIRNTKFRMFTALDDYGELIFHGPLNPPISVKNIHQYNKPPYALNLFIDKMKEKSGLVDVEVRFYDNVRKQRRLTA
jgi:hypothetical protein